MTTTSNTSCAARRLRWSLYKSNPAAYHEARELSREAAYELRERARLRELDKRCEMRRDLARRVPLDEE